MTRLVACVLQLVLFAGACSSPPAENSSNAATSSTTVTASSDTNSTTGSATTGSAGSTLPQVSQAGRFVDTIASGPPPRSALACSPKSLSRRDTLSLAMKTPHGNYLTVNAPDGTAYFIVYPQLGDTSRKYSLIPSEDFRHVSHLRLPADVQANPRVYGRPNLENLFTKTGNYVFHMGDNLEGDFGQNDHRCTVRYMG
jgi:hypothetical protein